MSDKEDPSSRGQSVFYFYFYSFGRNCNVVGKEIN